MGEWLRFIVFTTFGLFIGIVDFRIQKIPNVLLLMLLSLLVLIDFLGDSKVIPLSLLAGFGSFGLFFLVFWIKGGLGYGDVKYAGVIGYFLGPGQIINGLLYAVILGLVYWCIGSLIFRWGKDHRFPFGPWLTCGAIAAELLHRIVT